MPTTITKTPRTRYAVRINHMPNPSVANDAAGWASFGLGTDTGRVNAAGWHGTGFYRVTATGAHAGQSFGIWATNFPYGNPVIPNTPYVPSLYARTSVSRTLALAYRFFDSNGVQIGSVAYGTAATVGTAWTRLAAAATSPAGAVRIDVGVTGATTTAWASGRTLDMDAVQVEAGEFLSNYFDGDSTGTFAWYGTPNASASYVYNLDQTDIITPTLVTEFTGSHASENILHPILLGQGFNVTFRPNRHRSGEFRLLFENRAAAFTAVATLRKAASFTFVDTDVPQLNMTFVVNGDIEIELDDESRAIWAVNVPYQAVN